ncbi:MAG: hypothetical protein JSV88_13100, partial [Candidatus Aminicenantes bacterium]
MIKEEFSKKVVAAAGEKEKEKAYWLKKLSGELQITGFPYDFKRKHGKTNQANKITLEPRLIFTGEHFNQLMKISGQSPNRLYVILAAALMVLLAKYTAKADIIVAVPIFKQQIQGDFINTILLLRNQIQETTTYKELLSAVSQILKQALENQNYPLE